MTDLKQIRETAEQRKIERQQFYCYDECVKRGCKEGFLDAFHKRMFISPILQTRAFIEMLSNPTECLNLEGTQKRFKQWKIFLEVLIEKRSEHEKNSEWKKSLEIIENSNI